MKGFLWGLGTEAHIKQGKFFNYGKLPTIRQILKFLEIHQCKDSKVINMRELGKTDTRAFSILTNCFSARHIHQVSKSLLKEVKECECPEIINTPRIHGCNNEPWILITVKEIDIHFMLPDIWEELDLETRWFEEIPQEDIEEHLEIVHAIRKRWKGVPKS